MRNLSFIMLLLISIFSQLLFIWYGKSFSLLFPYLPEMPMIIFLMHFPKLVFWRFSSISTIQSDISLGFWVLELLKKHELCIEACERGSWLTRASPG